MPTRRLVRSAVSALIVALAVPAFAPSVARAEEGAEPTFDRARIEVELVLERRLLEGDLTAYREARTQEVGARLRVDELSARLDDQLAQGGATPPVRAAREAAEAREDLDRAAARTTRALDAVLDRLRRIAGLARMAPAAFGVPEAVKTEEGLAGRWRLVLDSVGPLGTAELEIADAVVFGTLTLPDGTRVAIRGSHQGNDLQLEPVAIVGSPTRSLSGGFDRASGQLQGSWQAIDPATGRGTGAGTWTGTRVPADETETIQQEDIE